MDTYFARVRSGETTESAAGRKRGRDEFDDAPVLAIFENSLQLIRDDDNEPVLHDLLGDAFKLRLMDNQDHELFTFLLRALNEFETFKKCIAKVLYQRALDELERFLCQVLPQFLRNIGQQVQYFHITSTSDNVRYM